MSSTVQFRRAMEAVEQISDAAPPWEEILSTARDLIGADSGTLIMMDGRGNLLNMNHVGMADAALQDYVQRFHKLDVVAEAAVGMSAGTWLDSNELFPLPKLQRTEFYTDFQRKHGLVQIVALLLEQNSERKTGFSFQRSIIKEGARSALSQGQVGTYIRTFRATLDRRSQSMANNLRLLDDTFSAMGEATFLLSSGGSVVHASGLAKTLLDNPRSLCIKQAKLWHPNAAVLDRLTLAVATTLRTARRSKIAVSLAWGETLSLDITVADPRIRLSNEPLVLVRMRRNSALNAADADNLALTFNISKGEARVLAGLANGLAPAELAVQNGVTESTVRTQITNLKRKMQCSRIVDLVKLALLAQS